jgi:hypothetical protein
LSCKAIHNWVEKLSQGLSKVADDARPVVEVVEATIKRFLCCGFRGPGGTSVSVFVEDMSRNKCLFQVQISHALLLYLFMT